MKQADAIEQYTDPEIVLRIQNGEPALFEMLIRRYNPLLYKTGRAYRYGHADTQDLMQDTFIDAFMSLSKFENRSSFKTWIVRIMLNNCFRKRLKASTKYEMPNDMNEKAIPLFSDRRSTDAGELVAGRELSRLIESALMRVPQDYRMVFSFREMSGFNVAETAEALGISESNVKVRLNRAKTMLRKEIERSYTAGELFEFNLVYCDAMVNRVMAALPGLQEQGTPD